MHVDIIVLYYIPIYGYTTSYPVYYYIICNVLSIVTYSYIIPPTPPLFVEGFLFPGKKSVNSGVMLIFYKFFFFWVKKVSKKGLPI